MEAAVLACIWRNVPVMFRLRVERRRIWSGRRGAGRRYGGSRRSDGRSFSSSCGGPKPRGRRRRRSGFTATMSRRGASATPSSRSPAWQPRKKRRSGFRERAAASRRGGGRDPQGQVEQGGREHVLRRASDLRQHRRVGARGGIFRGPDLAATPRLAGLPPADGGDAGGSGDGAGIPGRDLGQQFGATHGG